jgi:membrane protein YqaA with SNARE-associated domain
MDIRKTEGSVEAGGLQQVRTKNAVDNQKEKTAVCNFMRMPWRFQIFVYWVVFIPKLFCLCEPVKYP